MIAMSAGKKLFLLHSLIPGRSLGFVTLRKRTIFFKCVSGIT